MMGTRCFAHPTQVLYLIAPSYLARDVVKGNQLSEKAKVAMLRDIASSFPLQDSQRGTAVSRMYRSEQSQELGD